jgi:peptidoglycan hydrolase-like protein with peptidoglycan-binding domain
MKTWMLLAALAMVFSQITSPAGAQTGGASAAQPAKAGDGGDIERVQKALKEKGHDPGPVDGVMGPQTSAALRAYQKAEGLNATGRLDDATLAKLAPTGGDRKPSAVDPAQAKKTGANVGEGASYSRSTEKGDSKK